jgi:hypothetical protein
MPILASVLNFFAKPFENSVTMTLSGSIASGATTVPVSGMANYSDGDIVAFTVDPASPTLKQVFTGTKSGANVVNVVWTEGTNQPHTNGASIIDYVSATTVGMLVTGILKQHSQTGAHTAITATSVAAASATFTGTVTAANFIQSGSTANGWTVGLASPNTVTHNGNRSYTLVFSGTDITGSVSPGMRLKASRTVPATTQCSTLNGTTQFFNRSAAISGMSFTDTWTTSAWVRLTGYSAGGITSRYNGSSGWIFYTTGAGQLVIDGRSSGSFRSYVSYQSLPLNKWVHVAATMQMSTNTGNIYIDGVLVTSSSIVSGSPTAIVQAGNFEVGSYNGGAFSSMKIAQPAVYSAVLSQATIAASMNQPLIGTETSLISAYSLSNSLNDLNANGNNLTANAGALTTSLDSPFGGQGDGTISSTLDYGIIMKSVFSTDTTLTVQVPEGCTIPTSGGVATLAYSTQKLPYLFPGQRTKWKVESYFRTGETIAISAINQWFASHTYLSVPAGEWKLSYQFTMRFDSTVSGIRSPYVTLDTSPTNADWGARMVSRQYYQASSTTATATFYKMDDVSLASATSYGMFGSIDANSGTESYATNPQQGGSFITAENAYL